MHSVDKKHASQCRSRSSARSYKKPADFTDHFSQESPDCYTKDCCSQLGSSVSALSDVNMASSAEGDTQLESALQCEERHQFLSSPQDSSTSALSYQDTSRLVSPVNASRGPIAPLRLPTHRLEVSAPSPAEVPPEAIWDTESIACHGEKQYTQPTLQSHYCCTSYCVHN